LPVELYSFLVQWLFQSRLHQKDSYEITFAKRQKSETTRALFSAIEDARKRFFEKYGIIRDVEINISSMYSKQSAGL
jgi:hypothetical protein